MTSVAWSSTCWGIVRPSAQPGTDRMGGPGGAGAVDLSKVSETQLYEWGFAEMDRKCGRR